MAHTVDLKFTVIVTVAVDAGCTKDDVDTSAIASNLRDGIQRQYEESGLTGTEDSAITSHFTVTDEN